MKIVISLINYNNAKKTVMCLHSLNKLSHENITVDVQVIDNNSKEPLIVNPQEYKHISVTVIRNRENLGFSGGHNIAIDYALKHDASYVMILNNDTIVDSGLVRELLAVSKMYHAGIVGPKIYFSKGSEFHKDRYTEKELGNVLWYAGGMMNWRDVMGHHRGVDEVDHGQFDTETPTDFASGCCMVIKKEVFEKVGLLDTRYFLYYEDSDFNVRVKRAGFSIYFAPKAILWHENASSTGGSGSDLQDYFISRNRLLFGYSYAPLRTKAALFRESIRLLKTGREWQKKGVKDFYLRKFGKGSYAV